jgi:hypothetical protein
MKFESKALTWDGNALTYETQLKAFYDGWMGIVLLFVGTILHISHFEVELSTGIKIVCGVLFLSVIASCFLKTCVLSRDIKKVYKNYDETKIRMRSEEAADDKTMETKR